MRFSSNIAGVKGRLLHYRRGLTEAIHRSIDVKYWAPELLRLARETIGAQWAPEKDLALRHVYERIAPVVLQSFAAEMLGPDVAQFSLEAAAKLIDHRLGAKADFEDPMTGYAAQARDFNTGAVKPMGRWGEWHESNLEAVRQTVEDWVLLEKEFDERDANETPDQVVEKIQIIMGIHPSVRFQTPDQEAAAQRLAGYIQRWLDGEGVNPPTNRRQNLPQRPQVKIDPNVIHQWLMAVRAAWRSYIKIKWPLKLRAELRKLHAELNGGLGI